VAGGAYNDASETDGSILGGCMNTTGAATNPWLSQAGCLNTSLYNSVAGGMYNTANGNANLIGGGYHNIADGVDGATVIGGDGNTSNGDASTQISGLNRLIGGHNGAQVGSTGFNP
jgi:hypothetical protein